MNLIRLKHAHFLIFLLISLFCVSCSSGINQNVEPVDKKNIPTVYVEKTSLINPTVVMHKDMVTPTPSFLAVKKCINVYSEDDENKIEGNLILYPRVENSIYNNGTYLLDLRSREKHVLPVYSKIITEPSISPDGERIAYNVFTADNENVSLVISSSKGEVEKRIEMIDDLGAFWEWRNDNEVVISQKRDLSDYNKGAYWNIYSYNLINRSKELHITPLFSGYPGGFAVYYITPNHDLSYLIYSWGGDHPGSKELSGYEILDLIEQRTSFIYGVDLGVAPLTKLPIWYDNYHVIIVMNETGKEELYKVDMKGNPERLTNLGEYFDNVDISSWKLSPNKQKLGFYAYTGNDKKWDSSLYITDLITGETVDTCLKGDQIRNADKKGLFSSYESYGPIWAPDSQHLLLENRYEENTSQLLWVDLINNVAVPVMENSKPIGWMGNSN